MRVPETPVLIQFPVHVPEKTQKDGLSAWAPATHAREQAGVPGSWLLSGLALAIVVISLARSLALL